MTEKEKEKVLWLIERAQKKIPPLVKQILQRIMTLEPEIRMQILDTWVRHLHILRETVDDLLLEDWE
ncbi:MAG: hypothetical protein HWN68_15495 [Desulfobacterales bacterium]|nr:hypothetical protein [Desulfobacterales bacterium]